MVNRIFKFFCSLRLTVTLLCFAVVLVFVGTLAQVHEGLYAAQTRYFKSWLVFEPTIGNSVWPIILPGGYLLGTLLLINLLAAHIKRFQFTSKKIGIHLIHGGLILLLLGQLLTDMLSHESSMRLFEGSRSNYSEDYRANEFVMTDTSDSTSDKVVSIPESLLAEKGEIRHEALPVTLRVLNYWQNCDVQEIPPAQAVPVKADHGYYRDSSVLALPEPTSESDHGHPAVFVELTSGQKTLGSFLVTTPAAQDEPPQTFSIGGKDYAMTMLFAPMLGGNLLAVSRAGDMGGESMVTFPEADLAKDKELQNQSLPFQLRVKQFWSNCRIYQQPGPKSIQPKITHGALADCFVNPEPPVTDQDHRNLPGAVVELRNGKGSLGTWLLWAGYDRALDSLKIDGHTYQMALQFKRYYKPYSIALLKFSHDRYKGTDTPKNFSSRIRLVNPQSNEDRDVLIKMNNPLRYRGTTYYQAGFDKVRPDVTILEVVTNPGWLTPYLACVLVAAGMVYQFMSHLIGFATKRRSA
ncbi:MAG TPA: cytochrome c biogenesis protein ResB [Verrucomicrobiae bacterium]|nr:cytochrome c biogenesis protein ResB [Verrucomicrobiae bacterium]